MTTTADVIDELASHLESEFEYDIEICAGGIIVHGEFEMFGDPDVKASIGAYFARRLDVESYTVGVTTPAGSMTGPMVVEKIRVAPNA